MSWDEVIPHIQIGQADRVAEPAMNNEEFAAFYGRSSRSLWAYLARCSGSSTLADDLMQEAYVRFLCSNRPKEGEVILRRYLYRIATNLVRDHWRRHHPSPLADIPECQFASSDSSGHVEAQTMLGPALLQLRPRDRQLLWLAYAESYSHREIAEIMGIASASVRILLFRARRKVAQFLRAPGRRSS